MSSIRTTADIAMRYANEIDRLRRENRRLRAWMRMWEDDMGKCVLACVTMDDLRDALRGEKPPRRKS